MPTGLAVSHCISRSNHALILDSERFVEYRCQFFSSEWGCCSPPALMIAGPLGSAASCFGAAQMGQGGPSDSGHLLGTSLLE
mmetsp:Transcript_78193/g.130439  ORF Transcript_78193/g.130439 Transcript_78193/m.130439 type:complete len:82 (-) Transcript_78193:93-338(-)